MHVQEEEEGDDEEMGVAETYAEYWPSKRKLLEIILPTTFLEKDKNLISWYF